MASLRRAHQPAAALQLVKHRATVILREHVQVEAELVGRAAVLTDGTAGTVEGVSLDESHGLRISIRGHIGKWPISTIRMLQP
ncbi:PRC-barrel domain containing protein [uncultured Bradyrhizobium sp.]|uniref:PRC-barrel domain containing protein n=1 Tax=Bradyrhizobium sp. TaxID=376 RepID=UPI0026249707|nr:PRC-barrel domain containing protein [uncultured Bradyrhizobium sp.]